MTSILETHVEALWNAYRREPCDAAVNALLTHYLPLARYAALRLARRLSGAAQRAGGRPDVDELAQWGALGLRTAIAGFDPARGVKFETYCSRRIHGAMLDGLKSQHWAPRLERRKIAAFAARRAAFLAETGTPPSDETLAAHIGVCPHEIRKLERAAASLVSHSISAASTDDDHAAALPDPRALPPEELVHRHDVKQALLHELTRAQRLTLILHYYEDMTMREIAATLGVSPTRISQLHTEALAILRRRFARRFEQGAIAL
ncbi:MAG TPA: sigma-70 family RNA polymerase sigma factor [Phycisphaerae bacterium]|jgi:RNA polymerase sigma factor for flagellar operon FliA|nr:sigma-70 family RNA polymerase sigma factor [Phycisphaerae bacterium]